MDSILNSATNSISWAKYKMTRWVDKAFFKVAPIQIQYYTVEQCDKLSEYYEGAVKLHITPFTTISHDPNPLREVMKILIKSDNDQKIYAVYIRGSDHLFVARRSEKIAVMEVLEMDRENYNIYQLEKFITGYTNIGEISTEKYISFLKPEKLQ